MPDTEIELIDKNSLISELRSCSSNSPTKKEVIILDCRSGIDYAANHIKQSTNISIPTIMLRRLKEGKIDLFSTIKCKDLKNRILGMDIQTLFVLYHNSPAHSSPDIIQILSRKLIAEFNDKKIRVVCLAGEFPRRLPSYIIHAAAKFFFSFFIHKKWREFFSVFFLAFSYLSQNLWLNYISQRGEALASSLQLRKAEARWSEREEIFN